MGIGNNRYFLLKFDSPDWVHLIVSFHTHHPLSLRLSEMIEARYPSPRGLTDHSNWLLVQKVLVDDYPNYKKDEHRSDVFAAGFHAFFNI